MEHIRYTVHFARFGQNLVDKSRSMHCIAMKLCTYIHLITRSTMHTNFSCILHRGGARASIYLPGYGNGREREERAARRQLFQFTPSEAKIYGVNWNSGFFVLKASPNQIKNHPIVKRRAFDAG